MKAITQHRLAIAALLLTATAWGATFTLIKEVLTQIAPEPFIAWRFTIAGVVLCAVAFRGFRRELLLPGCVLGVLVFIGYWLQTYGLMVISPSRSAFLTSLYVVMVPFADRIIHGTRMSWRPWAASFLALLGTAALIGGFAARPTWGDMLTIFSAVIFALHVVYSARWSSKHSTTGLAAIQVLFVGVAAMPFAAFAPRPVWTPSLAVVIVLTALVTTALAFAALMWGQSRVTATEAAVILSFEPVAASLASIFWYREPLTTPFLIGAALILAAMILSQLPSATMRSDDPTHPRHE
ncbi:MAG TPA: DMT family transporter [Thermoanaerobaculia bacterium]